jgi:voltage-gated potassium channel
VFIVVAGWRIVTVSRSPPRLRAIEAVAVSVPLFILLFASAYSSPGRSMRAVQRAADPDRCPLLHGHGFATVGFGDIVATTDAARMLVMLQMLANLVLIGLLAKVLLGAVQRRRRHLDEYPQVRVAPVGTGSPGAG